MARNGHTDTLAFQIDLWSARGELPLNLGEAQVRQKEIQFSSRTRAATDQYKRAQRLRIAVANLRWTGLTLQTGIVWLVLDFGQQSGATPLTELPVLEIVSGIRIVADLTLDLGRVVHDYLA